MGLKKAMAIEKYYDDQQLIPVITPKYTSTLHTDYDLTVLHNI